MWPKVLSAAILALWPLVAAGYPIRMLVGTDPVSFPSAPTESGVEEATASLLTLEGKLVKSSANAFVAVFISR